MPDLMNLTITPLAAASISVPRAQISCQIVDSRDQSVLLADFTGANALLFPNILTTLSAAERLELVNLILNWMLQKKAPAAWQ